MSNKAQKRVRKQKLNVLNFLASDDFNSWTVLISRKSLTEGVNNYAEVDFERKIITVNPFHSVEESIKSVVHEVLHILSPKSGEKTILRWEAEVFNDLSPSEKTIVLQSFFSRGIWDE